MGSANRTFFVLVEEERSLCHWGHSVGFFIELPLFTQESPTSRSPVGESPLTPLTDL